MELENIPKLKKLIRERDDLLDDLKSINKPSSIQPKHIVFEWDSGYTLGLNIYNGTYETIRVFLEDLLNKKLDEVNNSIFKL